MENEPIAITLDDMGGIRKITIWVSPDAATVTITEYRGSTMQQTTLTGEEFVQAFATWYGEKHAQAFTSAEESPAIEQSA